MADDTSFSSRAIREFHNALTNGSIFGVPRYTTALLPPAANNTGGLVFDTTAAVLKVSDGSSWSAAGSPFTGGTVTSPIFAPQTAGGTAGTISYSFTGDTNTGMQNTAADTLVFYAGGVNVFTVSASGTFQPVGYSIGFGTSGTDANIYMNQNQTPDSLSIAVGSQSNSMLLIERADVGFDFAHPQQTDPTLFIHSNSQSTTKWISMNYSDAGGYGLITVGAGDIRFQNAITFLGSSLTMGSNAGLFLDSTGNTSNYIGSQSAQTPDTGVLATGSVGNSWVICETADRTFDFAHAAATDPTLFIHSHNQNTTQWIGFAHDGTNGVISLGTGDLKLAQSGTILAKDGTVGDVAYGFSTDGDDTGTWLNGAGNYCISTANSAIAQFNTAAIRVKSSTQVNWSSGDPSTTAADSGLVRSAAGVIKVTDGSTGGTLFLDTTNGALKFGTGSDAGLVRVAAAALRISDGGSGPGALQYSRSVEVNTGTKAPTAAETNEVYTNEGDADGSIINLPTAAAGLTYTVVCQAAQTITINASAGDTIRMAASVSGTAGLISTATVGNAVTLVAINATEWIATSYVGTVGVTWTVT